MNYVWNTLKIFKNCRVKIEWNKWKNNNREDCIQETIMKLAPPAMENPP